MSDTHSVSVRCSAHHYTTAVALCRVNKVLLCVPCVLEKAMSPQSNIIEIKNISDEKDTLLLECLLIKQIAEEKKLIIEDLICKTETVKRDLIHQVYEMYDKVIKRLEERKTSCQDEIKSRADEITTKNNDRIQRLKRIEATTDASLENLSAETDDDKDCIRSNLTEMKDTLLNDLPDKDVYLEAVFSPDQYLIESIFQPGYVIGNVILAENNHHEQAEDSNTTTESTTENREKDSTHCLQRQGPIEITEEYTDWYNASDEVMCSLQENLKLFRPESEKAGISEKKERKEKHDRHKEQTLLKPLNKIGGLFKRFTHSKTPDSDLTERGKEIDATDIVDNDKNDFSSFEMEKQNSLDTYLDVEFDEPKCIHPRYLINKAVAVSEQDQLFSSPCKFVKLLDLNDGYIGLYSDVHDSVVVARTDRTILLRKSFHGGEKVVVAMGKQEFAVVVKAARQVNKYKVDEKGFAVLGSFHVSRDLSHISGFDFDVEIALFAISSPTSLILVDEDGRILKSLTFDDKDKSETKKVMTTYDFNKDCLYIMNIKTKELKCHCFKTSKLLWTRKCGKTFIPRNLCLCNETLYITVGDSIAVFSTTEGRPLDRIDTKELLDDCLGICIIDDVILFSSNSDDIKTSTKVAFISI